MFHGAGGKLKPGGEGNGAREKRSVFCRSERGQHERKFGTEAKIRRRQTDEPKSAI